MACGESRRVDLWYKAKGRSPREPVRESDEVIVPFEPRGQHNLGRGKDLCCGCVPIWTRSSALRELESTTKLRGLLRKLGAKAQAEPRLRFLLGLQEELRTGSFRPYAACVWWDR